VINLIYLNITTLQFLIYVRLYLQPFQIIWDKEEIALDATLL